MFKRVDRITICLVLGLGLAACQVVAVRDTDSAPVLTQKLRSRAPSAPGIDAPELARLGQYPVGTTLEQFVLPSRVTLTTDGVSAGKLETAVRTLPARVWYPAQALAGAQPTSYSHTFALPGGRSIQLSTEGIAFEDARPVDGGRFPLVVVSHGYGGWSESMSYLTENLASKGYVVVAIDHLDMPAGARTNSQLDFANVFMDRARDQREVISALVAKSATLKVGYPSIIDPNKIGLIGYSMGGYGALSTAGAAYDPESPTLKLIPAQGRTALLQDGGPDVSTDIKAIVTIAPWGGQPSVRMWTAEALKQIRSPILIIDGDEDDIVDFRGGVRWMFDELSVDRQLLVFQGARHNVGNIPAPPDLGEPFSTVESFAEPIWRTDRINAINQHFVTAFLDLRLKGDASRAAYLKLPTSQSSDGVWKGPSGLPPGGVTAADGQPEYWRGFQRRWALGLEMHHVAVE